MDEVYTELEQFRKIYFEALKNGDSRAHEMRMKMNELERLIEENLSSFQTQDINKLVERMKNNVDEAMNKINKINDRTKIVANTISFIDDTLYFMKEML